MTDRTIIIKLIPSGPSNKIRGWDNGPEGPKTILKISVTAAPEKGKANKALIGLLSKELGIAQNTIEITRGETDRLKTVKITALPAEKWAELQKI